jgi:hypothetical protein
MAEAPDQIPMAAPRSFSLNTDPMIANEHGMSSAAPMPWIARARMSTWTSGAKPQQIDARVNMTMPVRKIRRRPS